MKCRFCGKPIKPEETHASLDIWDHKYDTYLSMNCCAGCIAAMYRKEGTRVLLQGNERFAVHIQRVEGRVSVAKRPLKEQYKVDWLFAKPQVDGLF